MSLTDEQFEAQQARVEALAERWWARLPLDAWQIKLRYHRESTVNDDGSLNHDATATCKAAWEYGDALMSWNLGLTGDLDDDELEFTFLHEVGHILIAPMSLRGGRRKEADRLAEEYTATQVARSLRSVDRLRGS